MKLVPIVLRCGEVEVTVDLDTLSGVQWRDMRQATGLHQVEIVDGAVNWGDFDCQAALMWVALRESEPDVSFELVLAAFSYASVGEPDLEVAGV